MMGEEPVSRGDNATTSEPKLRAVPSDPDELVRFLEERRARFVSTVDELVVRVTPGELLRRSQERVRSRLWKATRTPDGGWRWERVVAVASAATISVVALGLLVRRRFR
jgi:hypothetical protein